MQWLDRGLSFLLILGGIGHTLFWSLTATVLIFLLAAINLLRTWRPSDRALATLTSCASAAYLIITIGFGWLIGDLADPRVILFGVASLGLTAFGLRQALRS